MVAVVGVMLMDCSGLSTVSVAVLLVIELSVAVILVLLLLPPVTDSAVARPPAAIVATAESEECQVTCVVILAVLPSSNVPIASYC